MKGASYFRENARNALRGKWGLAVVAGLIASFLGASSNGGGGFSFDLSGFNNEDFEAGTAIPPIGEIDGIEDIFSSIEPAVWGIIGTVLIVGLTIGLVLGLAFFVRGSIVGVGYAKFNLNLVDAENAEINDLFKYFKFWKTTVLANLLRFVYIFLWSLLGVIPGIIATYAYAMVWNLLDVIPGIIATCAYAMVGILLCVIPGIIASFAYAMVPYIMAENPEMSASEACAKSKEMMRGYKFDLFKLKLSFIGWSLLCIFTCGIGKIVLTPYIEAAVADFYREVSGTRPVPSFDDNIPIYIPEA
jgi:uncharacterized membrane protein